MNFLIQFQINILAFIIFAVLFVIIHKKAHVASFARILMKWIILFGMMGVVVEPLTWIFDGQRFFGAFFLEYSTNFILVLLGPILGGLMLSYVDYKIFHSRKRIRARFYYMHAALLSLVLLIINLFFPLYFGVDSETNAYSTGFFFWFGDFLILLLYVYMFGFLSVHRKQTTRNALYIFTAIFLLPVIGMGIQLIDSKLHFTWTAISVVVLVAYAFLESTTGERDYLTNLYTRLSYENYVRNLVESEKPFAVVFLDLDKFKRINDQYGHQIGDLVLMEFARVLEKVFSPNEMVARLAGDEFMIVVEELEFDIIQKANAVRQTCQTGTIPEIRKLDFSYGYQPYDKTMTLDDLYHLVDQKMYQQKNQIVSDK